MKEKLFLPGSQEFTALNLFRKTKQNTSRIAVLSQAADNGVSPMWPKIPNANGRKWDYYDRCLRQSHSVSYFRPRFWERIQGYDCLFIHETLWERFGDKTVEVLARLKRQNGKIIWVELHEKSLYSPAIFQDGFFETVDLTLKHQMLEFNFLKQELQRHETTLAPLQFYAQHDLLTFLQNKSYFGFDIPDDIIENHLQFDFAAKQNVIQPIMYPFSWTMIQNGLPQYQGGAEKAMTLSYAGRIHINHAQRNAVTASLAAAKLDITYSENYMDCLRQSKYFMGLGHIHSSLRTFDTLAFDTVLVHYQAYPYAMWPEFQEYKTFIPFGNPHELFVPGGFGLNKPYFDKIAAQLQKDIADEALRGRLLTNQKALFHRLLDPRFIGEKLGLPA